MDFKFTKLAKIIIIFNVVLTVLVIGVHGYNIHRINVTSEKIAVVIEEMGVSRNTAITMLENDGENLFLDKEFITYSGILLSVVTLFILYMYAKYNGFLLGFLLGFLSLFTTFIGGLLFFYLIFSGKSEIQERKVVYNSNDEWEDYIYKYSDEGK